MKTLKMVGGHKVIYEFPILYKGWELDYYGWICESKDGDGNETRYLVLTNHGSPFIASKDELDKKIKLYEDVIYATKRAKEILNEKIKIKIS